MVLQYLKEGNCPTLSN